MKITVYSRGETVIDADPGYQEAPVRSILAKVANGESHPEWIAENILIAVDADKSNISHDEYAVVTEDDGTGLWSGWLTGDPEAAPPAEAAQARDTSVPSELDILRARAEAVRAHCEAVAKGVREDLGIPVRAKDVRLNAGDILRILDGEPAEVTE